MHEPWTDRFSEYLDGELTPDERREIDAHVAGCADCARTLDELRQVVEVAKNARPAPPAADLWRGIAARLTATPPAQVAAFRLRAPRRLSFTLPQLAAAAVLIAAVSGALAFVAGRPYPASRDNRVDSRRGDLPIRADERTPALPDITTVGFADAQYDQAVVDLERTLKSGRGKLDASTVAALEKSLQTIDQALAQARQALAADPANDYLSSHLVETRRRKLDFLRRAAALTETN